ncbi:MAG: radical SAM/SPASM domain-containing protein [Arcobacteraceae bacterium]|nr:radical SAM/SPASM domain-containing protein [Arcobacteraceae bacterium]
MHKFNKVFIELTNICGLSCSFCPTKSLATTTMNLKFFEDILIQLRPFTKEIAYHVFGDPLTLSNLNKYLDISHKHNFKVHITTTGYYLNNFDLNLFLHPAIKQINFSLNSFNKNDIQISLQQYLKPMFDLCKLKLDNKVHNFINFRLWNMNSQNSEENFNNEIFELLEKQFNIDLSSSNNKDSIRLENQIKLHFDSYFQWPSLESDHYSQGYCQGLSSHFGILSSGIVIPCCLDSEGKINLGNLHDNKLEDILSQERTKNIINGFKKDIAVEELCKKCSYKDKFKKN